MSEHNVTVKYVKTSRSWRGQCSVCPFMVWTPDERKTRRHADFHERTHERKGR